MGIDPAPFTDSNNLLPLHRQEERGGRENKTEAGKGGCGANGGAFELKPVGFFIEQFFLNLKTLGIRSETFAVKQVGRWRLTRFDQRGGHVQVPD